MIDAPSDDPRGAHLFEAIVWALAMLLSVWVLTATLRDDFLARDLALFGEAGLAGAALVLALLALHRVFWPEAHAERRSAPVLVALRLLLVPVHLFWLLAAAAGFAA